MSPTWKELEDDAERLTLDNHHDEVALAEDLERHVLSGFETLQSTATSSPIQELVYLLAVGATNSLHLAFDLALKGWHAQSLSLTRNAFEFWLAGAYVVCEPGEAPVLKEPNSKWPRPLKMRKRISETLGGQDVGTESIRHAVDKTYDYLCKFPHPTFASVGSIYHADGSLRMGPFYNRTRLLICLDNAYRTATLVGTLLETCFPTLQGTQWSQRGQSLTDRVNVWARTVVVAKDE